MRMIDADALQRRICGTKCGCEYEDCGNEGDCLFDHFIFHAPTIDPESLRQKGRWIVNRRHTVSKNPYLDDNYHIDVICSECSFCIQAENASFGFPEPIKTNYCPNCGADMRER